jgi:cyclopropane fatty-acyl-phospholipid synthase-like methyltransferase
LQANRPALTNIWIDRGVPAKKIERFYRGFSFYFAFCEAAFRPEMNLLQDWQLTFRPEKVTHS